MGLADNTAATLTPNPKYYGKAPPLDKLVFRVITDAAVEPTALRNHEVDGIFPQPQVDLLNNVKAIPSIKYQLAPGLQYEHFDLNLKNPFLADKAIRQAIFTAVNVKEIISKTVGQFDPQIKPILSRMYVPSQSGYEDNVTAYGLGSGDLAKAKQILTSAGYKIQGNSLVNPQGQTVPDFTMRYTVGNAIRQTQCQLLAAAVAPLGIKVNVQSTTSLGKTLTHKANLDYDIVVFAWVDTPFPNSGNNPLYVTGGGSNYGSYTSKEVDDLMNGALSSLDPALIKTNLNKADKILSQDAYTLPLYQKPVLIAYYPNVVNMRLNGTSEGPSYNGGEWGLRKVT